MSNIQYIKGPVTLTITGEMGSGKTLLVKEIMQFLGTRFPKEELILIREDALKARRTYGDRLDKVKIIVRDQQ